MAETPFESPKNVRRVDTIVRITQAAAAFAALWVVFARQRYREFLTDLTFNALAFILVLLTLSIAVGPILKWLSGPKQEILPWRRRLELALAYFTIAGAAIALAIGLFSPNFATLVYFCRVVVLFWGSLLLARIFYRLATSRLRAAALLVLSFLVLIVVGSCLLMMPWATANSESADWLTALFTSTSAVCVTGLNVVDTGSYWSRSGQFVILILIQCGGLGIMTFGAFFALIIGRGLSVRDTVLLSDVFESKFQMDARRLVLAVLLFTLISELIGALLLSTLWPHMPLGERAFFSLFHSISAFCNAGFALRSESFEGLGTAWQVWGVLAGLIIVGGLGFSVLHNLFELATNKFFRLQHQPLFYKTNKVRLRLTTKVTL